MAQLVYSTKVLGRYLYFDPVKYTFGVCRCDMAEMDFFAHEFIDIVEVMAEITCQVYRYASTKKDNKH